MNKIKYFINKYKYITLIIFILLTIIVILFYQYNNKKDVVEPQILNVENTEEKIVEPTKIKVDIKGYVKKPGVYELNENSRVIDAINSAGGLIKNANTEYINLSKKLTDEMLIIIYSNSDVEKFKETEREIIYIEYECKCPDNINSSCITKDDVVNTNGTKDAESEKKDNLVSINKGTKEELMTLNGIGESKANSIIEYRETNGEFKKLEDIMNVSGIGESAYSKIKDYIKL